MALLAAGGVWAPVVVAGEGDGIQLNAGLVNAGSTVGQNLLLTWSGSAPNFHVFRSSSPFMLSEPGNQIVFTGFASWEETSAPGAAILFYEVTSSCAPSPVEVCDGLDNDCDGATDEPGSESSCSLANATPQCVMGSCAIASCNLGFGNCDGAVNDGCEAPLDSAQSTSPAAYGGPGNPDLRTGYVRVASIANCGGCGVTCDDGILCTTDLCVPSGTGVAQCRHYDRAQCAGARCPQGNLPPGTPPPTEAVCAGLDADNDGLSTAWESAGTDPYTGQPRVPGIDINCNGVISGADNDLIWHEPPSGDSQKDVYLEIDVMGPGPGETEGHGPSENAVLDVISAFADAGVSLHVDPNRQTLPHAQTVYMPVFPPDPCAALPGAVSLYDSLYKGNPGVFDPRRGFGYHYMIFAHDSCSAGAPGAQTSGLAEFKGNDAIVSLGGFAYTGIAPVAVAHRDREMEGTMMHELGHNMGLCHGGASDIGCDVAADPNASLLRKPNYVSVMNYSYQLNGILRAATPGQVHPPDPGVPRRFDFSHQALPPLDETLLDEFAGVSGPLEPFSRDIVLWYCPEKSPGPSQGPAMGPIDWNCDDMIGFPVLKDVNADGLLTSLPGANDWDNLSLSFQCQPALQDGAQDSSHLAPGELTQQQADQQGLRAGPLSCGPGVSDCDGDDANGCEHTGPCGCTPSVEICDGLDNDCDGATDEPGSEASCSISNATAQCVSGSCAIASCSFGFGDCNGAVTDGCEAPLGTAQSTSPAAYGGPGNADLQPGYVRVAAIANCGGCGVSCDDGISCTTDLCVPSPTGVAQCRHYDRAQCGGARCPQTSLPPGTPPPTEAACAGIDADNDGLSNPWESAGTDPYTGQPGVPGIDINCNGVISGADNDLIWHEPPAGDATKDVYLEIDYMAPASGETGSHAPPAAALDQVVSAFSDAGIALHIDPNHQALPHAARIYIPSTSALDSCATPGAVSLYDSMYKGNPGVFDPRRRLGYHYMIFAHDSCSGASPGQQASGMAEVMGNDAIVSLGSFTYDTTQLPPPVIIARYAMENGGTFMHELGHNLGLHHGGPVDAGSADPNSPSITKKPNYASVMNYNYQLDGIHRSSLPGQIYPPDPNAPRRFDFSHMTLGPLDEMALDELIGLDAPLEPFSRDIIRHWCPARQPGPVQSPSMGPIDWNCDQLFASGVIQDVNADAQLTTLFGADDWGSLFFSFQCQPTLADGAQDSSRLARSELTVQQADGDRLRAGPLPCEPGFSDCDGNDANGCETTGPCFPGVP
jgi:hypothetical protein